MPIRISDKEFDFLYQLAVGENLGKVQKSLNMSDYEICRLTYKMRTELDERIKNHLELVRQQEFIEENSKKKTVTRSDFKNKYVKKDILR